jgi:hypothetical protein
MSYTVAEPSRPRPRPGPVAAASMLLYGTAALTLGYTALTVATYAVMQNAVGLDRSNGVGQPFQVDPQLRESTGIVTMVVASSLYTVVAVGFMTLGILVSKGKNPARIVAWVASGVVVICCGCGIAVNLISPALLSTLDTGEAGVAGLSVQRPPGWVTVGGIAVSALIVLSLLAVIVLLALPASHDYFRTEYEVWVPPTWQPGVGGHLAELGYPPTTGHPRAASYWPGANYPPEAGYPGAPPPPGAPHDPPT